MAADDGLVLEGPGTPGWWCVDNEVCLYLWWCGSRNYVLTTLFGVAFWIGCFVAICGLVYPLAKSSLEKIPSKFDNERGAVWFAWHVQSTLHATLVSLLAAHATWTLSSCVPIGQFGAPKSVPDSLQPALSPTYVATGLSVDPVYQSGVIGNTSHIFFCYMLVDTLITFYRKEMTVDYFLHHFVFCFFCVLIQFDCNNAYLAGWLLIMEFSTIWLNGFSFFRNRLGYDSLMVKAFFLLFALSFFFCRLFGTTYIACYFTWVAFQEPLTFRGVARWHLALLVPFLLAAVVLQFFWAYGIGKKVLKVAAAGAANAEGESGGPTGGAVKKKDKPA